MEQIADEVVLATGQTIQLIAGNILDANDDTDVIVFSEVSSGLELSGTDLLSRAGQVVEKQAKEWVEKNGPLDSSDKIALLDGGDLKAKHVILAAGPMWKGGKKNERNAMEEIVHTCLEEINKRQLHSIGLDAMCTDLFGFPTERSAEAIINAIGNWCHYRTFPYLNIIKIYVPEEEKLKVFAQGLFIAFKQAQQAQAKQKPHLTVQTGAEEEQTNKRKEHTEQVNQEEEESDEEEDDSFGQQAKKVKGVSKFSGSKNPSWKRNRQEHSLMSKAKKNHMNDKSTNMMSLVGDSMSISTSIAFEETNMNDEEGNDEEAGGNFDMTFL